MALEEREGVLDIYGRWLGTSIEEGEGIFTAAVSMREFQGMTLGPVHPVGYTSCQVWRLEGRLEILESVRTFLGT